MEIYVILKEGYITPTKEVRYWNILAKVRGFSRGLGNFSSTEGCGKEILIPHLFGRGKDIPLNHLETHESSLVSVDHLLNFFV